MKKAILIEFGYGVEGMGCDNFLDGRREGRSS
jgi:hypothetical protein